MVLGPPHLDDHARGRTGHPSVAKDYCHATHTTSCERRMQLPIPLDRLGVGAVHSNTSQNNDLWTASPVMAESTGSWSGTCDELETFGRQVVRVMRLPDVTRRPEGLVAGGPLALGRMAATIDPRKGLGRLMQALATISEEGLSQACEESYYDDEELEPVSLKRARRGIGEVGKVEMANSIWRRCVPGDVLHTYQAWDEKYGNGIPMVDCPAVGDMLSPIGEAGPLKRCSAARGTSKARVIPQNSQNFALIFACVGLNDVDGCKPAKFHMP